MIPRPPRSTLFTYTTLFRSPVQHPRKRAFSTARRGNSGQDGKRCLPLLQTKPGRVMKRQRSEEQTSELQSQFHLVCRLLLEKKKKKQQKTTGHSETTNKSCT